MTPLYVETSALLAWLLGQEGSTKARAAIDGAEPIVTSALTFLEIHRVLARASAAGALREGDVQRLHGLVARSRTSWIVMALTEDVMARAAQRFPVEPVRTLDALHLATALVFTAVFPDLEVLSVDERVTTNARALGLR